MCSLMRMLLEHLIHKPFNQSVSLQHHSWSKTPLCAFNKTTAVLSVETQETV